MEERNCPVCGKPVGDYLKENIRCGSCGSNLEVYRLLNSVDEEMSEKGLKWKPVAIASMIAALIFALLYIFTPKGGDKTEGGQLVELNDSVAKLNERIKQLMAAPAPTAPAIDVKDNAKVEEMTEEKKDGEKADEKAEKKEEVKADLGKVVIRDGKKYYIVESGDSWWKICSKVYGPGKMDYKEIAKLNGKPLDYKMKVGEAIQVK